MVSSIFLNLSLDYAKSTWSESQSAPGLVFADCVELSIFGCREYSQSNFNIDHLVMSMCKIISWVFVMTSVISWQNSVSLCPASFYTSRPILPVTPGISWLLTFAFQSPVMKRTSFFDVSSSRSCGRGQWQPTPVLLPGKSHRQRSLKGYSQWGR